MPFHFKKSESPAKAVRRVCAERVQVALDRLAETRRPEAIHGARKEIKKLRATLRLVRKKVGREDYRQAVKPLRKAAKKLAASRDARVMFRALTKLADDSKAYFSMTHDFLQKHWQREMRRLHEGDSLAKAEQLLRKSARRIKRLRLKSLDWPAIKSALGQGYARGQKLFQLSASHPSPENFHVWRRYVKDLWYQFGLLRFSKVASLRKMEQELEQLGECLGEMHDVHLLELFVAEHFETSGREALSLGQATAARETELRESALELGLRLYARKPNDFLRAARGQFKRAARRTPGC